MAGRREVVKYRKDGSVALKPSVQYSCQACLKWFASKEISIDHIVPVIPVDGTFTDWNTFVERLCCAKDNLQRLCSTCHLAKSNHERALRKAYLSTLDASK